MKAITKIPIAILVALAMSACQEPEKVDTIVHNAKIYTLDENNVIAEAIAISDGKIVEVGAENQILPNRRLRARGRAESDDAGGRLELPWKREV